MFLQTSICVQVYTAPDPRTSSYFVLYLTMRIFSGIEVQCNALIVNYSLKTMQFSNHSDIGLY
jgi:hypothetical protein